MVCNRACKYMSFFLNSSAKDCVLEKNYLDLRDQGNFSPLIKNGVFPS